jgi:hypothetical protein
MIEFTYKISYKITHKITHMVDYSYGRLLVWRVMYMKESS